MSDYEVRERLLGQTLEIKPLEDNPDTYRFSCASEYPVRVYGGEEILLHTRQAINLERLPGMVCLWEHGLDSVVGSEPLGRVVGWDVSNGRSYCDVRWANTDLGKKYRQLVDEGIVSNVSIRYKPEEIRRDPDNSERMLVTRYSVIHVSLVADPADPSVGYGRAYKSNIEDTKPAPSEDAEIEVEKTPEKERALSTTKEGDMEDNLPTQATPEPVQPAQPAQPDFTELRQQEMTRVRSITAMGQSHNLAILAEQLIDGGKSVEEARAVFDRELTERNHQKPLGRTANQDDYLPGFGKKENEQYSLLRAYRSRIPGTKEYTGNCFEKEVSQEISAKTGKVDGINIPYRNLGLIGVRDRDVMNTGTPAAGGYNIQTDVLASQFIDLLRNKSSVLSAGATFLPGLTGPVSIPGQATGATAYWITENENVVQDSITFRNVPLQQRTIAARLGITRNMIMQSSVEVENVARRDLAAAIALGLDKAALQGTGDGKQPTGVLNTSGIGTISGGLGTDGGALEWADLVALWKAIMVGNGDLGTMAWIMPAAVAAKLMVTPMQGSGVEGNFILKPDSDKLVLFPYQVTEQMPSNGTKANGTNLGSIILGVWSEFIIGNWGTLSIDLNPYGQAWGTGGLEMLALQSADCNVRNPQAFAALTDVTT
jgi:HK97 family phage major capsid protein